MVFGSFVRKKMIENSSKYILRLMFFSIHYNRYQATSKLILISLFNYKFFHATLIVQLPEIRVRF